MYMQRGGILLALGLFVYGVCATASKNASWYGVPIASGKQAIALGGLCIFFSLVLFLVSIRSKATSTKDKSADGREKS